MKNAWVLAGSVMTVACGWWVGHRLEAQQTKPAAPKAASAPAQADGAEEGVKKTFRAFLDAYGKADAQAMGNLFLEDALLIDSEANIARGREAITRQYADIFEANGGRSAPATAQVDSIRFLTPDVACVEGVFKLEGTDGAPGYEGRFHALNVRRDNAWMIAEVRDDPVPVEVPESNEEYLKELDWMVGEWVDEGDNARVRSTIDWAENKNFLVRKYTVEIDGEPAVSGTQYIGYDPLTGGIMSWVFDSAGGHGEGLWTRSGDSQWVIRASGVLRDGTTTSATQVVTRLNKDSVRLSSLDRIVGSEILPDAEEIVMVRKPPAPAADQ